MRKLYAARNLITLSKNGSLLFCKNCERILGSINERGYRYINLAISCKCGVFGCIEIAMEGSTSDPKDGVNRMPMSKDGLSVCKRCGMPLFGIIDERVKNYSFYVECSCGEKYDLKSNFPIRLGETLEKIKKSRN